MRGDVEEALQGRSPRRRCAQLIPFPPRKALLRPSARAPLSPVARTHLQIYETHVPFLRPHTSSLLIGAMLSGRAGGRLVCSRASHHSLVVHHARHCPLPLPCPTIAAPHPTGAADRTPRLTYMFPRTARLRTQDVSAKPRFFSGIAGTRTMIDNSRRCRHRTWTNRSWSATRCVAAVARNHSTRSQKENLGVVVAGCWVGVRDPRCSMTWCDPL